MFVKINAWFVLLALALTVAVAKAPNHQSYYYFVSFSSPHGFGNSYLETDSPFLDVRKAQQTIHDAKLEIEQPVILNYYRVTKLEYDRAVQK